MIPYCFRENMTGAVYVEIVRDHLPEIRRMIPYYLNMTGVVYVEIVRDHPSNLRKMIPYYFNINCPSHILTKTVKTSFSPDTKSTPCINSRSVFWNTTDWSL